jgi:hypothetical protein
MSLAFWKRLLRRWFVEYNPLYLLSAGCVLVGASELSQGLSHSAYSGVAVAMVAELYALALIGSAAFLMRLELRRPAVMLALLCAVYQCDPTLHTETCAYLGGAGALAAAIWLASFVGKLWALAWAMRVRISGSALFVPVFGAVGVLAFPPFLHEVSATRISSLVTLWLFALFALGLWGSLRVSSLVALDEWGRTVFKRTVRSTWAIWAVLTLSHVWFWADEFGLRMALFAPLLMLLSTRWMPRESSVWLAVTGALLVGLLMPEFLATIACLAALTLALRALRQPFEPAADEESAGEGNRRLHARASYFGPAERAARLRLLVGATSALHLSVWTSDWSGSALPGHSPWLDLSTTVVLLGMLWAFRAYVALVPLALNYFHLGVQTGTLSAPRTRAQWGLSEVGLGFALLAMALIASWQAKRGHAPEDGSLDA